MSVGPVHKVEEIGFNRQVGEVVRLLLKARRYTVGELGSFLGMSRENAQAKLSGKTKFSPYELRLIADWLQVEPEVFFRPSADLFRPGLVTAIAPNGPRESRYTTPPFSPVLLKPLAA